MPFNLNNNAIQIYSLKRIADFYGISWAAANKCLQLNEYETPVTNENYQVTAELFKKLYEEYIEYEKNVKEGGFVNLKEYSQMHNLSEGTVRGAVSWGYFEKYIIKFYNFHQFITGKESWLYYIQKDTDFITDRVKEGGKYEKAKIASSKYYEKKRKPNPRGCVPNQVNMIEIYLKTAKRNGHEVDFENKTIDGHKIKSEGGSYQINGVHITQYIYNENFDIE